MFTWLLSDLVKMFKMGKIWVQKCVIGHEIVRFLLSMNFSSYFSAFLMESEACKFETF